jgi:hypothetical protein
MELSVKTLEMADLINADTIEDIIDKGELTIKAA